MRALTPQQSTAVQSAQKKWLEWIFSTKPANRKQAEEGVRRTYRAGGVPEPEIFLWLDDLMDALLALEQLSDYRDVNWMLPPEALPQRKRVQRQVRERLGLRTWRQVIRAVGPQHTANRYEKRRHLGIVFGVAVAREDSLQAGLRTATEDPFCDCEPIDESAAAIERAARSYHIQLEQIVDQAAGPGIPGHGGIGCLPSIYQDYRFDQLFRHDCLFRICDESASAVYDGLRRTMQHCGPWWPFANAAILCDRPRIVHRDSEGRLHHGKEPAVVFRSGLELYAWHGNWVPAGSIGRQQESVTKVKTRAAPRRKPRNPLEIELPDVPEERIEVLRTYGPLTYYERYLAGEHRPVWQELSALGADIRQDPYAADALAVAYATMSRVRQNIGTLIDRLAEIGYEFEAHSANRSKIVPFGVARWNLWMKHAGGVSQPRGPFQPPEEFLRHRLRRLESDAGELPLSLRAWYEVVGSVTLMGTHAVLSAGNGDAMLDPLVVVPFSQILRDWDHSPPEVGVDGLPFVAAIAPDAHITLPAVGMDALMENERRSVLFVDYLRLAFEWGGFPGFEIAGARVKEIEFLSEGLLAF